MEKSKQNELVKDEKTGKDFIELEEDYAVIILPKEAVEVNLQVKVYHEGNLLTVGKKLSLEDIRDAFRRREDYIAPDDTFVLNEC